MTEGGRYSTSEERGDITRRLDHWKQILIDIARIVQKVATRAEGPSKWVIGLKLPWLQVLTLQSDDCTSNDRRREMKKIIFVAVLMVCGVALFSGCASTTGRTTGEYIDDSNITTEANAIIVQDPDASNLKIDVSSTAGNVVLRVSYMTRRLRSGS